MENLHKDMILYKRHPIIYTSWNLNDAPKAITSKRLSLKFTKKKKGYRNMYKTINPL